MELPFSDVETTVYECNTLKVPKSRLEDLSFTMQRKLEDASVRATVRSIGPWYESYQDSY